MRDWDHVRHLIFVLLKWCESVLRCSEMLSTDCRVSVNGVLVDGTEPSVCLSCDICSVGSV